MHNITSPDHQKNARKLKQLNSRYSRNQDLINVGAYEAGSDPVLDEAIAKHQAVEAFLQQDIAESASWGDSVQDLAQLVQPTQFATSFN